MSLRVAELFSVVFICESAMVPSNRLQVPLLIPFPLIMVPFTRLQDKSAYGLKDKTALRLIGTQ
jgi:hypothetical protein